MVPSSSLNPNRSGGLDSSFELSSTYVLYTYFRYRHHILDSAAERRGVSIPLYLLTFLPVYSLSGHSLPLSVRLYEWV